MSDAASKGFDNFWTEHDADEWSDALVAAMKLGGIDYLFFVSGSESAFLQEALAKAEALGTPAPKLVTMIHESVALNAALGASMVTGTTELRQAYPDGYAVRNGNFAGGDFDPPPNFAKYAETVDGYGEYVTETDRVGPALQRAIEELSKGSPAVVAVRVPGPSQRAP